ncbi:MAG: tetratricopeptide repeat protein [Phototrophicaceae bacterium]|jgi:tetratricopeptide (TPR) repeat protein
MLRLRNNAVWLVVCATFMVSVAGVAAQGESGSTTDPILPTLAPDASPAELVEWMNGAAVEINDLHDQVVTTDQTANSLVNFSLDLLGIFESVSLAITVVGAGLGVFGFGRLVSAETNLNAARQEVEEEIVNFRQQFQADLVERRQEFETLRSQITNVVETQRREAANSTLATALVSFGERQYRAADYFGAINTYVRAKELDSNNPITFYRLGYVYTSQGDLDAAEEHLVRSLEIDPQFAPAMVALGFVYRRKGEKMESGIEREQMFNKAEHRMLEGLKISPKLVDEDGESWWGALGGLYRRRNQSAQAIYAYEQATTVTPHSSYPFGNLANLYGRENNIDGMLRMYRRVEKLAFAEVQAEVDNYWGYFDLLTAQLALGHLEKANDTLPSVLETVPADAVYALESLVDTLTRVSVVLKEYPQNQGLTTFADRIKDYIHERTLDVKQAAGDRPEDVIGVTKETQDAALGERPEEMIAHTETSGLVSEHPATMDMTDELQGLEQKPIA